MGTTYVPTNVTGNNTIAAINDNFDRIAEDLDRKVSRYEDIPSTFESDLDANGYNVRNARQALLDSEFVTLGQMTTLLSPATVTSLLSVLSLIQAQTANSSVLITHKVDATNSSTVSLDQYINSNFKPSGLVPTLISTTSFSVIGNQTAHFPVGQRLKINAGATIYRRVTSSSFGSGITTVVVDSANITGITAVAFGYTDVNLAISTYGIDHDGTVLRTKLNTLDTTNTSQDASITSLTSTKANKVSSPTTNAIVTLSAGGDIQDSGTLIANVPGVFGTKYLHVRDEKAQNTAGGASVAGVQVRTLNTVKTNEISGASLAANQITLPAGTYYVSANAPSAATNKQQVTIWNATTSTVILLGHSGATSGSVLTTERVSVNGRFTIGATTLIELRHHIQTARATDGLGVAGNFNTEVYAEVELWKVA